MGKQANPVSNRSEASARDGGERCTGLLQAIIFWPAKTAMSRN